MQKYSIPLTATAATILAFILYIWTLAPGLTWAHHGADGGDFLAAAITNGVPHPSGYSLYMWLLQGWLAIWSWLSPESSIAWRGNLLSALFGSLSVGVTVFVTAHLLEARSNKFDLLWAGSVGLLWAISPLLWEQAIITEVYTLHALFITLLGWVLFNRQGEPKFLIPIIALGLANHLTFALLLPAALYYLITLKNPRSSAFIRVPFNLGRGRERTRTEYSKNPRSSAFIRVLPSFIVGPLLSLLFYLRIPLAASSSSPINWGYADNWNGFWWLISGQAYQSYLFDVPNAELITRVAAWAAILTEQFTIVGLGLSLLGLYYLDDQQPRLRNFGLLWVLPISLYAIVYHTNDSSIYLLAPTWMLLMWLVLSLPQLIQWGHQYLGDHTDKALMLATLIGIIIVCLWRMPGISLRDDHEAEQFIDDTLAVIEPSSIVITQADRETFALWYSAWASGELLELAPDSVLINYSLYARFEWYRRSMVEHYAHIPAIGEPMPKLIAANQEERAIFLGPVLVEEGNLESLPGELEQVGVLWRYR